jgi:hypothetical protein
MRLQRTQFALDEIKEFLLASPRNPLIENYLVQYLLVAFYSEFEEHVKLVISSRIRRIDDRRVAFLFPRLMTL